MVKEMGISEKLLFVQEKPNSYVLFIPPDMSSVKFFRKELRRSLLENHFTEENTSQIVFTTAAIVSLYQIDIEFQCWDYKSIG